jgi:hypothetical protein
MNHSHKPNLALDAANSQAGSVELAVWFVARNGEPVGPFSWTVLQDLATRGDLTPNDLLWRPGLPGWVSAGSLGETTPGRRAASGRLTGPPRPP